MNLLRHGRCPHPPLAVASAPLSRKRARVGRHHAARDSRRTQRAGAGAGSLL